MAIKLLNKTVILLMLLLCIAVFIHISVYPDNFQWDLKRYYYGALAYAAGFNPYNTEKLIEISHGQNVYDFVYPPPSLIFFQLFTLVDYSKAFNIFLFSKFIILFGLVYLWVKEFLPAETDPLFYIFCAVAFNSAFYWDIRSGNLIIMEQFLVWMAFYMYFKRKFILFCLFILMAAIFKITPILFLFLLWFSKDKKGIFYSIATVALYGVILLISYESYPVQFHGFLHNISIIDERGIFDPCTLPLLRDLSTILATKTGINLPPVVPIIFYFIITIIILFVSWRAYRVLMVKQNEETEKVLIFLFCLVYALILPHFKPYSYILLIVPTFFIIKRIHSKIIYITILVLSIFFAYLFNMTNWYIATIQKQQNIHVYLLGYTALILAYIVWGLYIRAIHRINFLAIASPLPLGEGQGEGSSLA
jgi:hypothetical protein